MVPYLAFFRPNPIDYQFFGVDTFVSLYLNGRGKLKIYGFFIEYCYSSTSTSMIEYNFETASSEYFAARVQES